MVEEAIGVMYLDGRRPTSRIQPANERQPVRPRMGAVARAEALPIGQPHLAFQIDGDFRIGITRCALVLVSLHRLKRQEWWCRFGLRRPARRFDVPILVHPHYTHRTMAV